MIVAKIANSRNDEYYTPACAIYPIMKYLERGSVIWCPFDSDESLYVKIFKANGFSVINTHISTGGNFFKLNIECDYIISNPPYSIRIKVLERLFSLNKRFAMLLGVVGLFDSRDKARLFKKNRFEIMYLNPRVRYFKDYSKQEKLISPPYQSVYLTSGILPDRIIFEELICDNMPNLF